MKNYLNFETDIKTLESELDKLKDPYNQGGLSEVDTNKISKTQEEIDSKLKEIYSSLDHWQTTMVARHEDRPKSKFFIDNLFEDFISLAGDRYYGEDKSVITGFPKFLSILESKFSPFSCPITKTDWPLNFANPVMTDLSSP